MQVMIRGYREGHYTYRSKPWFSGCGECSFFKRLFCSTREHNLVLRYWAISVQAVPARSHSNGSVKLEDGPRQKKEGVELFSR